MNEALKIRIKQNSDFASPVEEAMLNLMVAADHVRSSINNYCLTFGITSTQYNALRILRGAHPTGHSRNEIAKRMIEKSPDVTRLLDRLEKSNFVQREKSENDKRFSITKISDKGLNLLAQMDLHIGDAANFMGSHITNEDCDNLSSICEKIYNSE